MGKSWRRTRHHSATWMRRPHEPWTYKAQRVMRRGRLQVAELTWLNKIFGWAAGVAIFVAVVVLLAASEWIGIAFVLSVLVSGTYPILIRAGLGVSLAAMIMAAVAAGLWQMTGASGLEFLSGADELGHKTSPATLS